MAYLHQTGIPIEYYHTCLCRFEFLRMQKSVTAIRGINVCPPNKLTTNNNSIMGQNIKYENLTLIFG